MIEQIIKALLGGGEAQKAAQNASGMGAPGAAPDQPQTAVSPEADGGGLLGNIMKILGGGSKGGTT